MIALHYVHYTFMINLTYYDSLSVKAVRFYNIVMVSSNENFYWQKLVIFVSVSLLK